MKSNNMKSNNRFFVLACAALLCSFADFASYAAEKPFHAALADAMEQANTRLANEFVYGPGLLMDYVGPMPTPEEVARAFPNAMGWWTPVENGAMFTGQWMPAVVQRGDAALAKRLADGLLKLSEVSDVPGFIAR